MLSPHNKPAFLALIPPSFTSLNLFVTFFRPLQPHSSIHNWGKYENSAGSAPTLPVIYRKCSHAKQAVHTKSSRLWMSRLRVVPHFSSGIVEWAKREHAWKLPHARKGDTRRAERKMRDYRQSPSFWTNALLSQRKTLIGSSMEICQHLSKTRQPLSTLDIITICRTNN